MPIKISIRTPNHARRSGPWGELIILSHAFPVIPDHVDEKVVESLLGNHGHEWSAILVKQTGGGLEAYLWRSLTSSFDLFYSQDGTNLFVADTFAGCVVNLPPEARIPSPDAVIDHFLYRTVPGENSFCEKVKRTGHGMRIHFDLRTGAMQKSQFARYARKPHLDSEEVCLREVEAALDFATADFRSQDYAVLFSGGVDSTLLATYLPDNPLSTNTITSPEFAQELGYAQTAARLMGKETQVNVVEEADYLRRLEEVIDQLGMPPHHPQTVLLSAAFQTQPRGFITGDYADNLFGGFAKGFVRYGNVLSNPFVSRMLDALSILPSARIQSASRLAEELRTPPTQPGSVAFRFAQDPKISTLERFIPRSDLDRRLIARYEYVSKFTDVPATDWHWHTYLGMGQLTAYFCSDGLSVWRQLASTYGKSVYTPFVAPRLFETAMSIVPPLRYTDGRTTKHLLKKILVSRLPNYPVAQRKLSGIIPYPRYASDGPLVGWSEKYPPPEYIDAETLKLMHVSDRASFWHTIIFSIWKKRIKTLQLPPPLVSLEVEATDPVST